MLHGVPTILTKGAVDVLLDRCDYVRCSDGIRPMTEAEKDKTRMQNQLFQKMACVYCLLLTRNRRKISTSMRSMVIPSCAFYTRTSAVHQPADRFSSGPGNRHGTGR